MFNPQTADWSKFMTRWMWWKGYVWPGVQRERMDRSYRSLGYRPVETPYGRMWVKDALSHPLLKEDDGCREPRLGRHMPWDDGEVRGPRESDPHG